MTSVRHVIFTSDGPLDVGRVPVPPLLWGIDPEAVREGCHVGGQRDQRISLAVRVVPHLDIR